MSKRYIYLLERIRDGTDYPKGIQIWAEHPCTGWKVIDRIEVK